MDFEYEAKLNLGKRTHSLDDSEKTRNNAEIDRKC